jgi:haloalkane dehalogenase
MVLEQNIFVEGVLPGGTQRNLTDEEMNQYRRPFLNQGEDRRPTLSWPRNLPIDGKPADVTAIVSGYSRWLSESADLPKLFVNAEPGGTIVGPTREFVRSWPNQTEVTVSGIHYLPEDSPNEIGDAIANFVRALRHM